MHTLRFSKAEIGCFQTIQGSKHPALYNNFQLYIAFKEATKALDRVLPHLLSATGITEETETKDLLMRELSYKRPFRIITKGQEGRIGYTVLLTLIDMESKPQKLYQIYCRHNDEGYITEAGKWEDGIKEVYTPSKIWYAEES